MEINIYLFFHEIDFKKMFLRRYVDENLLNFRPSNIFRVRILLPNDLNLV